MTDYLRADLSHSRFEGVDFSRSRFHNVYFSDTVIRGAWLQRVEIDGFVEDVMINGVDVGPLIEAELDRRDPDRTAMRPHDADDFRRAWEVVVRRWDATIERARRLPEEVLHERVDGEWSFIETLRHLVFATDAWVLRAIMGNETPYHPLGLVHSELPADTPAVPSDSAARPSLDDMLAVRRDRMAIVEQLLGELTDQRLDEFTEPVLEPGYPGSASFLLRRCLTAVVNEEWLHRGFAERDLAVIEARRVTPAAQPTRDRPAPVRWACTTSSCDGTSSPAREPGASRGRCEPDGERWVKITPEPVVVQQSGSGSTYALQGGWYRGAPASSLRRQRNSRRRTTR